MNTRFYIQHRENVIYLPLGIGSSDKGAGLGGYASSRSKAWVQTISMGYRIGQTSP